MSVPEPASWWNCGQPASPLTASWGHSEMAALQDIREAPDAGLRAAQTSVVARVGPAAVGADAPAGAAPAISGADPKAIWDDDEIPPEEALSFLDAGSDPRPRAKFSMLYKQAVATEDVYLGTEKTPGARATAMRSSTAWSSRTTRCGSSTST